MTSSKRNEKSFINPQHCGMAPLHKNSLTIADQDMSYDQLPDFIAFQLIVVDSTGQMRPCWSTPQSSTSDCLYHNPGMPCCGSCGMSLEDRRHLFAIVAGGSGILTWNCSRIDTAKERTDFSMNILSELMLKRSDCSRLVKPASQEQQWIQSLIKERLTDPESDQITDKVMDDMTDGLRLEMLFQLNLHVEMGAIPTQSPRAVQRVHPQQACGSSLDLMLKACKAFGRSAEDSEAH